MEVERTASTGTQLKLCACLWFLLVFLLMLGVGSDNPAVPARWKSKSCRQVEAGQTGRMLVCPRSPDARSDFATASTQDLQEHFWVLLSIVTNLGGGST